MKDAAASQVMEVHMICGMSLMPGWQRSVRISLHHHCRPDPAFCPYFCACKCTCQGFKQVDTVEKLKIITAVTVKYTTIMNILILIPLSMKMASPLRVPMPLLYKTSLGSVVLMKLYI